MPEGRNYLLGFGERLTEKVKGPQRPIAKAHPYTLIEARERLAPRIRAAAREIESLPALACPQDECVAAITLHPAYIAKSFFPLGLLRSAGLEPVGSKPRQIIPDKGKKRQTAAQVKEKFQPASQTADLFVAGKRTAFRRWADTVKRAAASEEGEELIRLEDVRVIPPAERVKRMRSAEATPLLEVVLHRNDDEILEGFRSYMRSLGVDVALERRIDVQGLSFLPVRAPREIHEQMAQFAFLRVAREMPSLRELRPAGWSGMMRGARSFSVSMPHTEPLNRDLRVAVFDGGVPDNVLPDSLVVRRKASNLGAQVANSQAHGLAVTSALLFGPLESGTPAPQAYAPVEHYRVVDAATRQDPQGQYFDVLNRIMGVLKQKPFDFVNLSLGPDLPIEDDEVHVWTASIDEHFAHGNSLVCVAAGNTGEDDWDLGNARIQAPADGVNVLSVGACDCNEDNWQRAPYSSIGPGRSPGIIKPEILVFGGSEKAPFWVLDAAKPGSARGTQGTSFASPLALRAAIGVRAHLGSIVKPIALKALLVHNGNDNGLDPREVGWGRVSHSVEDLITCPEGVVNVLYQGQLEAGRYLRARVPLPLADLQGRVTIAATFCYATETDPQDPVNYTRAGLDVVFRPHGDKFGKSEKGKAKNPKTRSFFTQRKFAGEDELRRDAHKWEPCIRASETFLASSLQDPVFDIHYNARRGGMSYLSAKPIEYALVVTIEAKDAQLYNKIAQRYRTILEPLRPVIQIPIRH
jgi:hypothetical protein